MQAMKQAIIEEAKKLGAEKIIIDTGPIVEGTGILAKWLEKLSKLPSSGVQQLKGGKVPEFRITIPVK